MADPLWDDLSLASVEEALVTRYMGQDFVYLDSTESTQTRALQEAAAGGREGMMVIAEEQTAGHGRFERPWVSPRGSAILLSLILRPPPEVLPRMHMVAALAVVRTLRAETGLAATIKWPNDIQVEGRKIAGILIDGETGVGGGGHAVVGLGLNVNLDVARHPEIAGIATSVLGATGTPGRRMPLLRTFLVELEELYEAAKQGVSPVDEWKAALSTLGQSIRVTWPGDAKRPSLVEEGVAEDVTEDGGLLLRRADGTEVEVLAGEVTLRE